MVCDTSFGRNTVGVHITLVFVSSILGVLIVTTLPTGKYLPIFDIFAVA